MARASLREDDVPEVALGSGETDAHKATFLFFADASHEALDGVVGHLIENTDHLAWYERSIHNNQRAVGADVLRKGLEVDDFAFGHVATDFQRDLKSDPDGATAFWVPSPMHATARKGTIRSIELDTDEAEKQGFIWPRAC